MKKLFLPLLLGLAVAGCSGDADKIITNKLITELYDDAYGEFEKENYDDAAEKFQMVETQYPASEWSADALIMAAYSQYLDDDFPGEIA